MPRHHRPHAPQNTSRNGEVTITRLGVDHLIPSTRAEALRLAGGDVTRIQVISPHEALVR